MAKKQFIVPVIAKYWHEVYIEAESEDEAIRLVKAEKGDYPGSPEWEGIHEVLEKEIECLDDEDEDEDPREVVEVEILSGQDVIDRINRMV